MHAKAIYDDVEEWTLASSGRFIIRGPAGDLLLDVDAEANEVRVKRVVIGEAGGAHPDLAVHDALGLATDAEMTAHVGAADPHTGYQRESGKGAVNGYASLDASGLVPDAQISAAIARDSELHAQAHAIGGADHTGTLGHAALSGTGPDDHHARQHSITSASDHTFPGGSTFLRADGAFASPPGGSEAFPVGSVFIGVVATNPATLLGYGTWSAFAAGRVLVGIDAGQTEFDTVEEVGGAKTHGHTSTQPADHGALAHADTAVADHVVTQPSAHTEVQTHTHPERGPSAATGPLVGWSPDTSTNTSVLSGYSTDPPAGAVSSVPHSGTAVDAHGVTQPSNHAVQSHSGAAVADGSSLPPYIVVYMWKRTA